MREEGPLKYAQGTGLVAGNTLKGRRLTSYVSNQLWKVNRRHFLAPSGCAQTETECRSLLYDGSSGQQVCRQWGLFMRNQLVYRRERASQMRDPCGSQMRIGRRSWRSDLCLCSRDEPERLSGEAMSESTVCTTPDLCRANVRLACISQQEQSIRSHLTTEMWIQSCTRRQPR